MVAARERGGSGYLIATGEGEVGVRPLGHYCVAEVTADVLQLQGEIRRGEGMRQPC